jgi:hypothetical protein
MPDDTPSSKPEFPPLLSVGRHAMNIADLHNLCVSGFSLSTTRATIMGGLERVFNKLSSDSIEGEVWVDGSFITCKLDPEDVDLVLRCSGDFYDMCTVEQRDTVNWLSSDLKLSHHCHSFLFFEWPEGHKQYWVGQYMQAYWMKQFGFSRSEAMKGIAVLALPGGAL